MPPDYYTPQFTQQFMQGMGYGAQPRAADTKLSTWDSGGSGWGGIASAIPAVASIYGQARHAATMPTQQVAHPRMGLYQTAQAPHDAYGGPSVSGGLANAGAGALSGAATGASIGSAIPGIGTAIGAGIGAVAGAIPGFIEAGRSGGMHEEWQRQMAQQQREVMAHNANVGMWQRRERENQAMLNGFGQPKSYY